jgi:hypothetical protein
MVDLRERLSLVQLFALLDLAGTLLSNDSAPIHIAGAFENRIILIPSCKHPDHILPYRYGSPYWRAAAVYRSLTLPQELTQPTQIHGTRADIDVEDWSKHLPTIDEVMRVIAEGERHVAV